jgi:transposase
MKERKKTVTRYIGIDLGKRTYEVAIVEKGGVKISNGKTCVAGRQLLYKKLRPSDKVALEAGNLAFIIAKELEASVGCQVYVLNPSHLPLIYGSMKKTDKEDSLKLAHIIEDFPEERLPVVPVPSDKEMGRRKLLARYRRAQQSRVREINRLHGLFLAQGITTMKKQDLSTRKSREEAISSLSGIELEEAKYLVACLDLHEEQIDALQDQIGKESAGDEVMQRLQSVPGVGPIVAFAFASHVASERFESGSQVSNYLGLVPRAYISGETVRYGKITKRGNGYLRALLVQAAWAMTNTKQGGKLKERFEYMTIEKSISKKKAIVAIARRIAELLYVLMRDGTSYEMRPFVREKKVEELAQLAMSA